MANYFTINNHTGLSPFQNTLTYLGGSTIQIIIDNPITSYHQLIQQYAKDMNGNMVSPTQTKRAVNKIFLERPIEVAMSGLKPRLGACFFRNIDPNKLFIARHHNPNATLYILTKIILNSL